MVACRLKLKAVVSWDFQVRVGTLSNPMTVSPPFYVIRTVSFGKELFFHAKTGLWYERIPNVQRYATANRAIADCEEFNLCEDMASEIVIAPYRLNIGHNGQTVILPA